MIENLHVQIDGLSAAVLSILDLFSEVLESRDAASRAEIALRLEDILVRERVELAALECQREALRALAPQKDQQFLDLEVRRHQHALMQAFVARLAPPKPAPRPAKAIERS
jgi:hypothetical protein